MPFQSPKPVKPKGALGPNNKVGGGTTGKVATPSAAKRSAVQQAKPLAKAVKKSVVKQAKTPMPNTGKSYR